MADKYEKLSTLSFRVYTSKEIKKFSVLDIYKDELFDEFGEPVSYGLYDSRLGPNEIGDRCDSCRLSYGKCPGHSGHISLPTRVYNPVFLPQLFKVLRGCCFHCHRIMAPDLDILLLLRQLEALEYDMISILGPLEDIYRTVKEDKTIPVERKSAVAESRLRSAFYSALKDSDTVDSNPSSCVITEKSRLLGNFVSKYIMGNKEKCPHCFAPKEKITLQKKCIVFKKGRNMPLNATYSRTTSNSSNKLHPLLSSNELLPDEAKELLLSVWENDEHVLKGIWRILCTKVKNDEHPADIFFMDTVIVPPLKFRRYRILKGKKYADEQTLVLQEVLKECRNFKELLKRTKLNNQDFIQSYKRIQKCINEILDCDPQQWRSNQPVIKKGVKQILERKEGLFRRNLMGKRVNYAGRSVITPDPFIMVDEVGIPLEFAKTLTFPERVTKYNIDSLREAVRNGPENHPGANMVKYKDGKVFHLDNQNLNYRQFVAAYHLNPSLKDGVKVVYRHCKDGDMVLLNRQPTLHRPSIMAHKVRVLPGEKTLRLHYAHCKAYNADFDGDEMNIHLPQSYPAQVECQEILNASKQYLVPKDGTPLTGLIQDHVVAAVLLTLRNNFLPRETYQQLVYSAVSVSNRRLELLRPCIMKPEQLWSGKQVVSAVILNIIPKKKPLPNLTGKAKISSKNWQNAPERAWRAGGTRLQGNSMSESEVIIRAGELLCGVLDKAQIGATSGGLIHLCYELYGGDTASLLLSAFSRLLTCYLQYYSGFSMALDDIALNARGTRVRQNFLNSDGIKTGSLCLTADTFNMDFEDPDEEKVRLEYKKIHCANDESELQILDNNMKRFTNFITNSVNKECMRNGLMKKFPNNSLQLMVESGAKGTPINATQMCCLVGQTELEGRRIPLMANGKTLALFDAYDTCPEAGGFVKSSFYLGLKPEEFFFQCMAGREGLIDSAVKTSTSGYLQRRLIKHLEGVSVRYDLTVRDSDESVIQFLYGEDGLDVTKMQLLKEKYLHLLQQNSSALMNNSEMCGNDFLMNMISHDLRMFKKKIFEWVRQHPRKERFLSPIDHLTSLNETDYLEVLQARQRAKERLDETYLARYKQRISKCPDPVNSVFRPDTEVGVLTEKMDYIIYNYTMTNAVGFGTKYKSEDRKETAQFLATCYRQARKALAEPGEAVGILAAQSIGEPSTQMTLNTFHFAGKGEMNVTLGIPRIQEIVNATLEIKTPTMDLPILDSPFMEEFAEVLHSKLSPLSLEEVLTNVEVKERISLTPNGTVILYELNFNLLEAEDYFGFSPIKIMTYIAEDFQELLSEAIKKELKKISKLDIQKYFLNVSSQGTGDTSGYFSLTDMTEDNISSSEYHNFEASNSCSAAEYDYLDNEGEFSSGDETKFPRKRKTASRKSEKFKDNYDDVDEAEIEENTSSRRRKSSFTPATSTPKKTAMEVNEICIDFHEDKRNKRWCMLSFELDVEQARIDMKLLLQNVIKKAYISSVPGINKAIIVSEGSKTKLQTNGVNFLEIFKYAEILDINKIYTNDIHSIAKIYGIEAAAKAIQKELECVFKVYGIHVDRRHLSLISDYMTSGGEYKPFDRRGIKTCSSPLQKMSFETTTNFMVDSMFLGPDDHLKSPSANIVVGQRCHLGTGSFEIIERSGIL